MPDASGAACKDGRAMALLGPGPWRLAVLESQFAKSRLASQTVPATTQGHQVRKLAPRTNQANLCEPALETGSSRAATVAAREKPGSPPCAA